MGVVPIVNENDTISVSVSNQMIIISRPVILISPKTFLLRKSNLVTMIPSLLSPPAWSRPITYSS